MGSRHELHYELRSLLGTTNETDPTRARVYFQPPESIRLLYPCYIYRREPPDILRADNRLYGRVHKYGLIYITLDPDDPLIEATEEHFSMCRLSRPYAADGLNHYYYDLYY